MMPTVNLSAIQRLEYAQLWHSGYTGGSCIGLENNTLNDVCPKGHYCPRGSIAPLPCPVGTNSSSVGLTNISQCLPCTGGYYCPVEGTVYAELLCSEGYYCPPGTVTPYLACPAGSYCPIGAIQMAMCPAGTFQPLSTNGTCVTCPQGYLCKVPGLIAVSEICPIQQYCEAGSALGTYCFNGTYGSERGLRSQSECLTCEPGQFCTHGMITGNCTAGYFCRRGQYTPAPYVNVSLYPDVQDLLDYLDTQDGGPCTPSHFCPFATAEPIPCENGTVRVKAFGESQLDCGECPLGYLCAIGDPVPVICSAGQYCPQGQPAVDCPRGSYNSFTGQHLLDSCKYCPPGSFCNETSIASYSLWPCPTAHFCEQGSLKPVPCPAGTFRNVTGAGNIDECYLCEAGNFCPFQSVNFIECDEGYYCLAGASNSTIRPPGFT